MRYLLFFIFNFSFLFSTHAQDTIPKPSFRFAEFKGERCKKQFTLGMSEFLGVRTVNFDNINSSDSLFASIDPTRFYWGVSTHLGNRDKSYVSLNSNFSKQTHTAPYVYLDPYSGETKQTTINSFSKVVNMELLVNKVVFLKGRSSVIAFAGLGRSSAELKIRKYETSAYSGITGEQEYFIKQWNIDLGLAYDLILTNNRNINPSLSVKAGYLVPAQRSIWTASGQVIHDTPGVNLGGFYAGLCLTIF
jgi:hypothetical protein